MVFCNLCAWFGEISTESVTILILIDGFLQFEFHNMIITSYKRHNPYFNRWFSAMKSLIYSLVLDMGHNPYFNRWFSAIHSQASLENIDEVTILILIDGFLQ